MNTLIPVLSLVVAVLAVFVGPIVSWAVAKRQIAAAQLTADRNLISPMRQAWINDLRKKIAEILASSLHYHVAGFEERSDQEYRRLGEVEQEIILMANPYERAHRDLLEAIRSMVAAIDVPETFPKLHARVTELAQTVLKTEWEVVKGKVYRAQQGVAPDDRPRTAARG